MSTFYFSMIAGARGAYVTAYKTDFRTRTAYLWKGSGWSALCTV